MVLINFKWLKRQIEWKKLHEKSKLSANHFILMCMLPKKLLLKAKDHKPRSWQQASRQLDYSTNKFYMSTEHIWPYKMTSKGVLIIQKGLDAQLIMPYVTLNWIHASPVKIIPSVLLTYWLSNYYTQPSVILHTVWASNPKL